MDPDGNVPTHSIARGDDSDRFEIAAGTGVIQLLQSLDRETTAEYTLLINATDGAGNFGITNVLISVTDVNDEAPDFQEDSYTAFLNENSLEGTIVLPELGGSSIRILAVDRDAPNTLNSQVVYRLEGSNARLFNIDSSTGIVTVARGELINELTCLVSLIVIVGAVLDFETTPTIPVTIVASDSVPVNPQNDSVCCVLINSP